MHLFSPSNSVNRFVFPQNASSTCTGKSVFHMSWFTWKLKFALLPDEDLYLWQTNIHNTIASVFSITFAIQDSEAIFM